MAVSCVTTSLGSFYHITDSGITHLLGNYIGYGERILMEAAEKELTITKLNCQFNVFYKDIKRVLYDNFKMKKKISEYDDIWLANQIIDYTGGDDDNYLRNSLIVILKILDRTKDELKHYDGIELSRDIFGGEASYLHLLLFQIEEFASQVAFVKEGKTYRGGYSRKRVLAQEVYDLARRVPRGQTYTNEMTHIYESIFFIRQAIELKVLESLQIEAVVNKKHSRPVKISPDMLISLLDSNAVKLQSFTAENPVLDVGLIKKVHSWTNAFIHSGHGYWSWEVEFVRLVLQDFIFGEVKIDSEYLKMIPEKVLQFVKKEERLDTEVIMSDRYRNNISS